MSVPVWRYSVVLAEVGQAVVPPEEIDSDMAYHNCNKHQDQADKSYQPDSEYLLLFFCSVRDQDPSAGFHSQILKGEKWK